MVTIFAGIVGFAVFFIFLSLRILLKKGGNFRGTCASQRDLLFKKGVEEASCPSCGRSYEERDKGCLREG